MTKTAFEDVAIAIDPGSERAAAGIPDGQALIDCDVHATLPGASVLLPYLSDYWQSFLHQTSVEWFDLPIRVSYPHGAPTTARPGVLPAAELGTAARLDALRAHTLGAWGAETAIVNPTYFVDIFHSPYLSAALASATNDWLIAEWLDREPRFRGSIVVPAAYPDLAIAEIERVGDHPSVVQVLLPARSATPYGNLHYHPLIEAATRHGLVLGLHYGGWPDTPPMGVGWPSHYIEEYACRGQHVQVQLLSLVAEGVFDRFPETRVAVIEGGFGWLPSFMWRFDKDWKGLRREVPWLKRLPSEYVREHVRVTMLPFDGPSGESELATLVDQIGTEDILMFSTDYPHWTYDLAAELLPPGLGDSLVTKLLAATARTFYRLED